MTLRPGEVTLTIGAQACPLPTSRGAIANSSLPVPSHSKLSPSNNRVSGVVAPRCPIATRRGLYTLHKRAIEALVGFVQAYVENLPFLACFFTGFDA